MSIHGDECVHVSIEAGPIVERLNRVLEQVATITAERTDQQSYADVVAFLEWLGAQTLCIAGYAYSSGTFTPTPITHETLAMLWLANRRGT